MPQYKYAFTPNALKRLRKLSPEIQKRIIYKLDWYCSHDPLEKADQLTDFRLGSYKFSIGDYRVVFDLEMGETLVVRTVKHRRDVYRD